MYANRLVLASFLVLFAVPGVTSSFGQTEPRRIVLFIGDGVGASYWTAAVYEQADLAVREFRVAGLVDTRAATDDVTDSAASATAFATGVRTYNGAIGVDVEGDSLRTVLDLAKQRGMSTGLVATSSITHATPAAFAAHVPDRIMQYEIARQIADSDVDVLLGGGRQFFDPARRQDSLDLLARLSNGHVLISSPEELERLDKTVTPRLVGLFADNHMPKAADRRPALADMTKAALGVLHRDPEGFFLMVEASQPDWRGHGNEPLSEIVSEMLDFDRAIGVALEYQRDHPETLIVVVSDHETGGLAIQTERDSVALTDAAGALNSAAAGLADVRAMVSASDAPTVDSTQVLLSRTVELLARQAAAAGDKVSRVARYTTGYHTAQMVPLFASGPGAEKFSGIIANDQVGRLLMQELSR